MGDRARVFFHNPRAEEVSPPVYLHWDGYQVGRLLDQLRQRMKGREGDTAYVTARFVGLCHEAIPGALSLGVEAYYPSGKTYRRKIANLRERSENGGWTWSPGDAGCFLVNCANWTVEVFGGYGFGDRQSSGYHGPSVEMPVDMWTRKAALYIQKAEKG